VTVHFRVFQLAATVASCCWLCCHCCCCCSEWCAKSW